MPPAGKVQQHEFRELESTSTTDGGGSQAAGHSGGPAGGVPVSQVCEKYAIRPAQFYQWEKTAQQAALAALKARTRVRRVISAREAGLRAEIERLREVIAEISTENLELKKGSWR